MANESAEKALWKGHPSQLMAFKFYLLLGLIALLLIGMSAYAVSSGGFGELAYYPLFGVPLIALIAVIKYFLIRTTVYQLTSDRLIVESGIFSRDTEEMELYRVRDWSLLKPFWLRLAGRGHLRLISTDSTAPELLLRGIAQPDKVREVLRTHVEAARDRKRVRQLDVDGGGGHFE